MCDLELHGTDLILLPNTLSIVEEHLCLVISKSKYAGLSYSPDKHKSTCFLPLTSICDLDLLATDLILKCDTLLSLEEYFCQDILKSIHAYGVRAQTSTKYMILIFDLQI